MSPRRNHEQPRQNNAKNDHGDFSALEAELKGDPNRQERRQVERAAARAEAEGFAQVTGQHYRGGISA